MQVRVAVVGATGYTGEEIVSVLSGHDGVKITALTSRTDKPVPYSDMFPRYKGSVDCVLKNLDFDEVASAADVVFLSLPHTVSQQFAPAFLKAGKKVIDLSADYRLSKEEFVKWYKTEHTDEVNLGSAVYGLPELYREKIKKASLVANPGCYPTGALLGLMPLYKNGVVGGQVIIDAKSGVTGAGRKPSVAMSFGEVSENFKAYKINEHQHIPEITKILKEICGKDPGINFVPHLLPVRRGILSTMYVNLSKDMTQADINGLYKEFYKNEPFVRVYPEGQQPELKNCVNTNYCDIGLKLKGRLLVVVSCIDNLLKGAAGQAVQNMNIMCGFDEKQALVRG